MPEDAPTGHTCFNPAFPRPPLGYKIDVDKPMQLTPLGQFTTILVSIDICHDCWVYALCNFNVSMVNQWSAEHTVSSPAAVALGGLTRFAGLVNSVTHPMFNDPNPPAFREGRSIIEITGHEARKGTRARKPRLTYVVQYRILDDPRTSPPIRLPEFKPRQYAGAYKKVTEYWYGNKHPFYQCPLRPIHLGSVHPFCKHRHLEQVALRRVRRSSMPSPEQKASRVEGWNDEGGSSGARGLRLNGEEGIAIALRLYHL
ncbi:hypothetical protein QFC20_006936 [Naganishia adeliensis]|uniref:Uncharacterized protein n=1 Tax=Naganishia adeliensis TaxID=92952 RepID=A0ACC2V5B4_9TREE|nr:hypothetical protein QFC20_006936 [Naganishia adeliensis]